MESRSRNELARSCSGKRARQVQWESLPSPTQYAVSLFGGGSGGSAERYSLLPGALSDLFLFCLKNGLKWFYACAFWESRHNIWLIRWAPSTTGKWSERGWWPHWVILRELYLRPWESFHLRDLPFGGHPDFLCPTAQRPPCGPLWPSFQDMGSVPGEIVVFFSLQGATSLRKDSFSQQAKMTWKSDSARVTNWTFSREKYYLIETSFYPAEKLYCAVGIVSY